MTNFRSTSGMEFWGINRYPLGVVHVQLIQAHLPLAEKSPSGRKERVKHWPRRQATQGARSVSLESQMA